jgi:hypothetical protein
MEMIAIWMGPADIVALTVCTFLVLWVHAMRLQFETSAAYQSRVHDELIAFFAGGSTIAALIAWVIVIAQRGVELWRAL